MPFQDEFGFRTCPWCKTQDVSLVVRFTDVNNPIAKGGKREWSCLACPRCGAMVLIETDTQYQRILKVVPEEDSSEMKVEHLPDDVAEYYNNAQAVLNAGVPSAAAVELRRTLEAAAKHQGINEQHLVKAIEKLTEKGLITQSFTRVLGHIRKIGNLGAHASDQKLGQEEVVKALTFTTQILRNLFEIPKELEMLDAPSDKQDQEDPTVIE